jgi:hypothetical protein
LISIVGIPYTAIYYIRHERNKKRTYWYMRAFIIDVKANVTMGEFFECFFAQQRGLTSFGRPVSISACIGELIVYENFKKKYEWFSKFLDFLFNEPNHCVNAYYSEIGGGEIKNIKHKRNEKVN